MKKLSGKYITIPLARRIIGLPGHASSAFNRCVGAKLYKTSGGRNAFASAAKECKGTRNR